VASENFCPKTVKARPEALPIWLEKGKVKKFQVGTPLTPNIAMVLPEAIESLKNFNPKPGVKFSLAYAAVVLVVSAALAVENLSKPFLAPLKIPVYFVPYTGTNSTYPTFPTLWIYFILPAGISSPVVLKESFILSLKIPA